MYNIKKHEKFSKAGDGKMTVELIKIMENDIKRCEEAQKSKADSENFYLLQINQMKSVIQLSLETFFRMIMCSQ